jgi:hypothetical protein
LAHNRTSSDGESLGSPTMGVLPREASSES